MTCSAAQRKRNLSTNWVEHAEEHHRSARRPQKGQRRFSTTPAPVEEAPKGKPVPAWQQDVWRVRAKGSDVGVGGGTGSSGDRQKGPMTHAYLFSVVCVHGWMWFEET